MLIAAVHAHTEILRARILHAYDIYTYMYMCVCVCVCVCVCSVHGRYK